MTLSLDLDLTTPFGRGQIVVPDHFYLQICMYGIPYLFLTNEAKFSIEDCKQGEKLMFKSWGVGVRGS